MENSSSNIGSNDSTEQRILVAAHQEFVENGLNGSRMQSIAARAGVNKALIHYYYRSKGRLYQAVLEGVLGQVWEELEKNFGGLDESADIRTVVRTLVSSYISVLKQSPGFPQLFLRELAEGGAVVPEIVQGFISRYGPVVGRMIGSLKHAVQTGSVKPIDPIHIMINLMGMCAASFILRPVVSSIHENVFHYPLSYDEKFYAARITAITEMALNGIMKEELR